ncbi:MAG: hypothetical protein ABJE47_12680 [bacterium]
MRACQPVRDAGATRAPLDPNQQTGKDRTMGGLEATWTPNVHWTNRLRLGDYHLVSTFDNLEDSLAEYPFFIRNFNFHQTAVFDRATARYVGALAANPSEAVSGSLSHGADWQKEYYHGGSSGGFGPSTAVASRPVRFLRRAVARRRSVVIPCRWTRARYRGSPVRGRIQG